VHMFPAATGRDIKGLTKLTAKFCNQKNLPPTADMFIRCAVFRGLDLAPEYAGALAEAAE
jgi:hypothetical protein